MVNKNVNFKISCPVKSSLTECLYSCQKICIGPTGPTGPIGPVGPAGPSTPSLLLGTDGKDGKDGTDGKDGNDGKDGTDGKDGNDGKDGSPGAKGDQGDKGEPGAFIGYSTTFLGIPGIITGNKAILVNNNDILYFPASILRAIKLKKLIYYPIGDVSEIKFYIFKGISSNITPGTPVLVGISNKINNNQESIPQIVALTATPDNSLDFITGDHVVVGFQTFAINSTTKYLGTQNATTTSGWKINSGPGLFNNYPENIVYSGTAVDYSICIEFISE